MDVLAVSVNSAGAHALDLLLSIAYGRREPKQPSPPLLARAFFFLFPREPERRQTSGVSIAALSLLVFALSLASYTPLLSLQHLILLQFLPPATIIALPSTW